MRSSFLTLCFSVKMYYSLGKNNYLSKGLPPTPVYEVLKVPHSSLYSPEYNLTLAIHSLDAQKMLVTCVSINIGWNVF